MFPGISALGERRERFSLKIVMLFAEALLQAVRCLRGNMTSGDESFPGAGAAAQDLLGCSFDARSQTELVVNAMVLLTPASAALFDPPAEPEDGEAAVEGPQGHGVEDGIDWSD